MPVREDTASMHATDPREHKKRRRTDDGVMHANSERLHGREGSRAEALSATRVEQCWQMLEHAFGL